MHGTTVKMWWII